MRVAVYGSLRVGEYNFNSFARSYDMKHIDSIEVPGFDLYSLGSYPAIIKGENTLKVDILDVEEAAFHGIKMMELGAGYSTDYIEYKGDKVPIYIFDDPMQIEYLKKNKDLVSSGDWVDYNKSN